MDRREFINSAVVGSGLALLPGPLVPGDHSPNDKLHVALIGHGKQGQVLFDAMKNIPGLHFQAVCDIWDYNRKAGIGRVRALQRHLPNAYADLDDLLATENGLDAAIIATPDFWHASHTVKCLEAGLHVYCEKMMSNTLDGARAIVRAAEKSGRLCQIGYQRRSNPRYLYTLEQLLNGHRIFGRIVNVNGQWNRSVASSEDIRCNPRLILKQDILTKYGFNDMTRFMNWRQYLDLAAGPCMCLASHQIDVFTWFLGVAPKSVMVFGSNNWFKHREHFDNVMAVFEYDAPQGPIRASHQVVTSSPGIGGYHESFMGITGTLKLSEQAVFTGIVGPHGCYPDNLLWSELLQRGFIREKEPRSASCRYGGSIELRPSRPPVEFDLPGVLNKPPHQPHLENFFAAIRGETTLNCDARRAFASEAPMHWVNPSARSGQPITFTAEHLSC